MKKSNFKKKRVRVILTVEDRKQLEGMLWKGVCSVRVLRRAQALLWMGKGLSCPEAAALVPQMAASTARSVARRYIDDSLERALFEDPRPGGERKLSERQSQQIIAQVCGPPPDSHERWSTSLIAEEAVKRGIVDSVGRETIRILLKSHDLKPWRKKNVVCAGDYTGVCREDGGRPQRLREAI